LTCNAPTYRFRDIRGQMSFEGPKTDPHLFLVSHLTTPKDIATKSSVRMTDLPSQKLSMPPPPRYLSDPGEEKNNYSRWYIRQNATGVTFAG